MGRVLTFDTSQKIDKGDCPLFRILNKMSADFMNNSWYMSYSRVEVAVDSVAKSIANVVILFKQKVEIATLPSVARNDITLLEVTAHQQVARNDNLSNEKVVRFARPKGKRCQHKIICHPSEIFLKKVSADFMNNS